MKRARTLRLEARRLVLRPVTREDAAGAIHLGLERTRIERDQGLAGPHLLALGEVDTRHDAGDLGARRRLPGSPPRFRS
jgi:hypothetical protein